VGRSPPPPVWEVLSGTNRAGKWKEGLRKKNRLTRITEATKSPPPPQPGVKRRNWSSGSWVFEIVDLERETQAAVF
ncbi:hypothetical protein ACH498_34020, partial [Rhodococcus erythropolis]